MGARHVQFADCGLELPPCFWGAGFLQDVAILRRDFPFLFGQWYQQLGRRGDDWNFPSLGVSARWRLVHCQPARLGLFAPGSQARLYLEGLTQVGRPLVKC